MVPAKLSFLTDIFSARFFSELKTGIENRLSMPLLSWEKNLAEIISVKKTDLSFAGTILIQTVPITVLFLTQITLQSLPTGTKF